MEKLFGSSGVRGLVNAFLTPQLACKVGMAVATHLKAQKALIARDTRVSGPMLEEALISGLTAAGTSVQMIGILPTPAAAYLTKALGVDMGLMLTASHNPPQYNGIKVFRGDSLSFTDENQNAVEEIIARNRYILPSWSNASKATKIDVSHLYLEMLTKAVKLNKQWRIIADPGCGATFNIVPAALNGLKCKITTLNAHADGYFSARNSEPTAESLVELEKAVKVLDADVGVAFDGDGDRAAFVDEDGIFVDFDRILAAYSAYILRKSGGGTIVTNIEASMCVENMVNKYGGKVVRARVGDVYVSEAMARVGAIFGGEPCGAWVHPQWHWCPDGPLSAVLILKALEEENLSLSEFIAEVPRYVTLRENISCKNDEKQEIISNIEKTITQVFTSQMDFSTVDGVRLVLKNGWLLIRASGTEPLIRLTVEGESLKAARDIMDRGVLLVNANCGDAI